MAKDWLEGVEDEYDVVVIGSGLGGLSGANYLAKNGHKVLLLEHHYQYGGLATWFKRPGRHIFDISLHGFPFGMKKSCRKYWTTEIADMIVQLKHVRFVNPQFNIWTTFDRIDFTDKLVNIFGLELEKVEAFYDHLRGMDFFDKDDRTTGDLFEEFFPGRTDVHRLLMEPITYANGSTLNDPAITYGIVFSNFMSKGVFTFKCGTDVLIGKMVEEMEHNGVELRKNVLVEKIQVEGPDGLKRITGVMVRSRKSKEPRLIKTKAVLSNANVIGTIKDLVGEENFSPEFLEKAQPVRINSSSCQVYIGIKEGEEIPDIGDLVFCSESKEFSSDELVALNTTSRTFSVYYPDTRPESGRTTIVTSINATYDEWTNLSDEDYQMHKARMIEESLVALEKFIPDVRQKISHLEAATPKTVEAYTRHPSGTSFGTKFEGLPVSLELPEQIAGLHHAGSVGIIMSGWLGAINYGIITANKMDKFLYNLKKNNLKSISI
ncbi:MAG: FAD-binding protein [Verrucomicrobia bacterium]|nr:FAD-binding protein [Verrucomicrobiota bacterium]MDA1065780.1 FAD-binding protein [Verrucomicrobiota bacterium]